MGWSGREERAGSEGGRRSSNFPREEQEKDAGAAWSKNEPGDLFHTRLTAKRERGRKGKNKSADERVKKEQLQRGMSRAGEEEEEELFLAFKSPWREGQQIDRRLQSGLKERAEPRKKSPLIETNLAFFEK